MKWRIEAVGGEFGDDTEFDDPQLAICSLVLGTGEALLGREEPNGGWSVRRMSDNKLIAFLRPIKTVNRVGINENPGPLRRWHGLTWVGWLNTLFLQFLGVRLVYALEEDGTISGWGYCFMWPFARRLGRFRRLTRQKA